jgi:hypothetical protein
MTRFFEQRRAPRKRATAPMPVVDVMSDMLLGQLGNLSATGLMLLGPHAPRSGAVHQVSFVLADAHQRDHAVVLGVQEQWHEAAAATGQFWAGYRIVAASDEDILAIDEWIGPPAD